MALCCTMFCVYAFVIVYISPKVSLVENQKTQENIFKTRIKAYKAVLRDKLKDEAE